MYLTAGWQCSLVVSCRFIGSLVVFCWFQEVLLIHCFSKYVFRDLAIGRRYLIWEYHTKEHENSVKNVFKGKRFWIINATSRFHSKFSVLSLFTVKHIFINLESELFSGPKKGLQCPWRRKLGHFSNKNISGWGCNGLLSF